MATPLTEAIFGLEGKVIVVTGACGFLGRHFAQGLLQAGGRVILMSHSDAVHQHLRDYEKEFGERKVSAYQVDFYERERLDQTLQDIVASDRVDVLVNNAYDFSPRTGFNTPEGGARVLDL